MSDLVFEARTIELLQACPFEAITKAWEAVLSAFYDDLKGAERQLCLHDRYYLLTVMLNRPDAIHPWLYERCREVEAEPDGRLDLWAREHYKSTIITFAGIIQEVLRDPSITVGIFSHTKPIAKGFLSQIKREFEVNERLQRLFPDILFETPQRESSRWALDGGIIVKRDSNAKEATVEAHGLVDGQPTSKHFGLLVYDDTVTLESVSTPEQIEKTTNAWSLSDNLGARGHDGRIRKWHIGTRYHFADSYHTMIERESVQPRVYAATDDGTRDGTPVFLTQEAWEEKKRDQIDQVLAAQMLQNPAAGNTAFFDKAWLQFAEIRPATLNIAVLCDPASSRKKGADSTAIAVIGLDAQGNYWLLDGLRSKMGLHERWTSFRYFYWKWQSMPGVQGIKAGYERYGMQSDLDYFTIKMHDENKSFPIEELNWPREGLHAKNDRIQRLEPLFRNGKFFLAKVVKKEHTVDGKHSKMQKRAMDEGEAFRVFTPTRRKDQDGNVYSLNKVFLDEYLTAPFSVHDDVIDAVSRLFDIGLHTPVIVEDGLLEPKFYEDGI